MSNTHENNTVLSSLIYKVIESFCVKGLGFVIGIVLARLLVPEDFGQIALITVFINLGNTFAQSGLSTALVQNKTADHKDYSTVFYISLSVAVFSVLLLWITAPLIGTCYRNDAIVLPLRVYSFSLLFSACTSVQQAKIQREMKFRQNMFVTLLAVILSGALGILTALFGWGIWALILYYFSNTILSCFLMFPVAKWRPRLEFSASRAKELFSYGWKMLFSGILCSLYYDIRTLAVGKLFSEKELGYYSRGEQLPQILTQTLDTAVNSVMFPVLSKKQEQEEAFRKTLQTMLLLSASLVFPALFGLAIIADPLIPLLLTEKWIPCIPVLQLLCFGYASFPFMSCGLVAIKAGGYSGLYMRLEEIRRIMMLTILIGSLLWFHSVEAVAWGAVLSSWIDAAIVTAAVKKQFHCGLAEQFRELWKPLLACLAMGIAVWGTGFFLNEIIQASLLLLVVQIVVGIAVYMTLVALLSKPLLRWIRKIFEHK
ncbi:MAG: lipopolysaccharide biosynthesis protein [Clostridia bacterium]|nr:lipopolysaccharide biosynthesis protein [Clostridia bacterium]